MQILCRVNVLALKPDEVKHDEDEHDENHYSGHSEEGDAKEFIIASEGINFREVDVFLAVKARDVEYVVNCYRIVCTSFDGGPEVTPKLDEVGEALHLIPYHDMLIGDVKPSHTLSVGR